MEVMVEVDLHTRKETFGLRNAKKVQSFQILITEEGRQDLKDLEEQAVKLQKLMQVEIHGHQIIKWPQALMVEQEVVLFGLQHLKQWTLETPL